MATLCVALSLTLFALGGVDLTGGFCLRPLSFGRPLGNRGARLGYGCRILCYRSWHNVRGVGRHVNMGLLRLVRAHRFTSSLLTPQDYKSMRSHLCTAISSRSISRSLLTSFLASEKKERKNGITGTFFSNHHKTRLESFQGYALSPAKPCGLPRARGPSVPLTWGMIHDDLCGIL
jgi:hypothetical protein